MIGRVYRGGDVGGLLRYLYGPGRHNEHENPHLVAAWDLQTPTELATLEPEVLVAARDVAEAWPVRDLAPLTSSLELATALRALPVSVAARQVWHCPLRVAPTDRELTDAEWGQVAREVLHATGIARQDDPGGCRWVAVRHDAHSVHLVAVLARQDGAAARISFDHLKVRQACRDAEVRLGLAETAPADRTAATHVTRAEVEKTHRTRGPSAFPDRVWLREQVQLAALQAESAAEFLSRLSAAGVLVRERRNPDGALSGYAVAREPVVGISGAVMEPVFYGGGKLAPDLSLPRLQNRWQEQSGDLPAASGAVDPRPAGLSDAVAMTAAAARVVRDTAAGGGDDGGQEAAAVAEAAGQLLVAAACTTGGDVGRQFARVARQYDRAGREPAGPRPPATSGSRALRGVARALLTSSRGGAPPAPVLLIEVLKLIDAVRQLREAQGRLAQAKAASRSAAGLAHLVQQHEAALPAPAPSRQALAGQAASTLARVVPPPVVGRAPRRR